MGDRRSSGKRPPHPAAIRRHASRATIGGGRAANDVANWTDVSTRRSGSSACCRRGRQSARPRIIRRCGHGRFQFENRCPDVAAIRRSGGTIVSCRAVGDAARHHTHIGKAPACAGTGAIDNRQLLYFGMSGVFRDASGCRKGGCLLAILLSHCQVRALGTRIQAVLGLFNFVSRTTLIIRTIDSIEHGFLHELAQWAGTGRSHLPTLPKGEKGREKYQCRTIRIKRVQR